MVLRSLGHVTNGVYEEIPHLISQLHKFDGKRALISITEYTEKRSEKQNRYCWGVAVPTIKNHLIACNKDNEGITDEQVYAVMKYHHGLTRTIELPNHQQVMIEGSAARLGTQAFEDFLENARAMAASWGCVVPLPNEVERLREDYDGRY
jgi:hypothetical protein